MPPARTPSLCALALSGALALSLPTLAFGADPPKKAAKPGTPLLTRDELRACMNDKTRLHEQREELLKLQDQLDAEKAELERQGAELKERLTALDRSNQEQVEQYVASHDEHEQRIDAYAKRSVAFNTKVDTLSATGESYKKNCENRRYDEKDEIAIKKEKGQ